MNKALISTQFQLLVFLFILVTPSTGQENTKLPGESPGNYQNESDTIPTGTSVKENQTVIHDLQKPWVDPLFFIDGQLCQHVRKIFQDKSGNLWFGTNIYSLMRYNGDRLEYITEEDGLGGGRITGIVEDKEGNLWFGTYLGLSKYDGKSFTNYSEKDGLLNNEIWSLIIDSNGIFWIGNNEGLSRFDGETFTTLPIPKAQVKDTTTIYSYNRITCILEDRNGIFWFGTDGFGICKYDGTTFTHITKEDGLPGNNISEILEDKKGNIWIGTMFGGVSMFDGKSFTNFTMNGVIDGVEVAGLYEDKTGNIWFAAENYGVYRYDGKSFTNFHEKEGLVTNGILSIFEDKEGRFWLGGWGGLFRYDVSTESKDGKTFFSVTKDGPWK